MLTTYTLPVYWATALVNDDWSGMSDDDERECREWLARTQPGYCVGVSEETWFAWRNDATTLGGDVAEYSFIPSED